MTTPCHLESLGKGLGLLEESKVRKTKVKQLLAPNLELTQEVFRRTRAPLAGQQRNWKNEGMVGKATV